MSAEGPVPMFPLATVLFPHQVLPLHVFEPRYRALVSTCLEGRPEFGVVLIERGSEVGGGDSRTDAGTLARIVDATSLPDGRWFVTAVGTQRVRVERWLADDPHPWAELQAWPDPPPTAEAGGSVRRAEGAVRRVLALAAELGRSAAQATFELPDSAVEASYLLAAAAPLGSFDRQRLLVSSSVEQRLALLADLCEEAREVLARDL